MDRRWKRSDITDEMVCRAYLPQMAESEAEAHLGLAEIMNRAVRQIHDGVQVEFADGVLMRETGAPWKIVNAAMERACDRDLIEYGVTMRSGWLTDKGRALVGLPVRAAIGAAREPSNSNSNEPATLMQSASLPNALD